MIKLKQNKLTDIEDLGEKYRFNQSFNQSLCPGKTNYHSQSHI